MSSRFGQQHDTAVRSSAMDSIVAAMSNSHRHIYQATFPALLQVYSITFITIVVPMRCLTSHSSHSDSGLSCGPGLR